VIPSTILAALVALTVASTPPATRAAEPAQKPYGTIAVAAASDLTDAMKEIATHFEKETGCAVRVSVGSSGNFLSQMRMARPSMFFSPRTLPIRKNWRPKGLQPQETLIFTPLARSSCGSEMIPL